MPTAFSIIVPVYNRPDELKELLASIVDQEYEHALEVVIVEDGSEITAAHLIDEYAGKLDINYLPKENTGPGDSRNYGMRQAKHDYFIILDSDCILAKGYLHHVASSLSKDFVHCFGGPDTAHESFSDIQKAINYSLTSFITTGGIRGKAKSLSTFEPRSFNMGLSRTAFEATGGFGDIHPGEDPDLVWRLRKAGYNTRFIPDAVVYHKRRVNFKKFYAQVNKFGKARPILRKWHPESSRITHWLPTLFLLFILSIPVLAIIGLKGLALTAFILLVVYSVFVVAGGLSQTGEMSVGVMALAATYIQFAGYGLGFLKSIILLNFSKKKPRELFPELFYN